MGWRPNWQQAMANLLGQYIPRTFAEIQQEKRGKEKEIREWKQAEKELETTWEEESKKARTRWLRGLATDADAPYDVQIWAAKEAGAPGLAEILESAAMAPVEPKPAPEIAPRRPTWKQEQKIQAIKDGARTGSIILGRQFGEPSRYELKNIDDLRAAIGEAGLSQELFMEELAMWTWVPMLDPRGRPCEVPRIQVQDALKEGYTVPKPQVSARPTGAKVITPPSAPVTPTKPTKKVEPASQSPIGQKWW